MQKYAVIGNPILHSLSPFIHNEIYNSVNIEAKYIKIISKSPKNLLNIADDIDLDGINITAPFKSIFAKELNSDLPVINTIDFKEHIAYNTDINALKYLINTSHMEIVVVLGGGNTSFSAAKAAKSLNKQVVVLSRDKAKIDKRLIIGGVKYLDYKDYSASEQKRLFISTLPSDHYLDLKLLAINEKDHVLDSLYYNTVLKQYVEQQGATYQNGVEFLVRQAVFAHNLWHNMNYNDCDNIISKLNSKYTPKTRRIALIGFMGAGKTEIGKRLAQRLKFDFVDTDELIEQNEGYSITEIFSKYGEKIFREKESKVLENIVDKDNIVVACGGGIIETEANYQLLSQFDHVLWIYRDLSLYKTTLYSETRPLWDDDIEQRFRKRIDKYFHASTALVDNNLTIEETIDMLYEEFKRIYDN